MSVSHYSSSTTWSKINSKTIPHSKYPVDSVYDDADCSTAIQCAGFSKFILKYLWGSETYGTTVSSTDTGTAAKAKTFLDGLTAGSRIVGQTSAGSDKHSMILLSKGTDYVNVYHANWDYANGVKISKFPHSDWCTYYPKTRALKA